MLQKKVIYEDFDGEQQEEVVLFHLTKTQLSKLYGQYPGGLHNYFRHIVEQADLVAIEQTMTHIIEQAYGVRSVDGKKFYKSDELLTEFRASSTYDEVLGEYLDDPVKFTEFLMQVVPSKIGAEVRKEVQPQLDAEVRKEVQPQLDELSEEPVDTKE